MIDYETLTKKQQNRYHRILKLAEELFYEHGFYKLSLSELTAKLKVSRSTIYEYFDSKEGLVETIALRFGQKLDDILYSTIKDKKLSTRKKFIAIAQAQGQIIKGKNKHKFIQDLRVHTPHIFDKFEKGRKERVKKGYQVLIKQGVWEGLFDKKLPEDFLLQLYLKMGQLVSDTDILEHTSISKEKAMEVIIRIYLNGAKKI